MKETIEKKVKQKESAKEMEKQPRRNGDALTADEQQDHWYEDGATGVTSLSVDLLALPTESSGC